MKSSNHHFVPISLKHLNVHSKEFFDTHLSLKPKPNHWVGNPTDLRRLWKVYLMGTWGGVAYHLDAQAGRSTRFGQMVRKLKFRTGQFRSASRLPFLQISSIYQKTTAKAHEKPQEVIFLHGIWRHIEEFGIEGQIPRISLPAKLEKRC